MTVLAVCQSVSESRTTKEVTKDRDLLPIPKGKGKSAGKSAGKSSGKVTWITEMTVNGNKRQLCMRYQSGKCDMGSNCRFHHACAYPMPTGEACGKSHGALLHDKTPH